MLKTNLAYVTVYDDDDFMDNGVVILDVSDPNNITYLNKNY